MVPEDQSHGDKKGRRTRFPSLDAVGTMTGISTYDRALACGVEASLGHRAAGVLSGDRGGDVFPLRARDGTEGTCRGRRLDSVGWRGRWLVGVLCCASLGHKGEEVSGGDGEENVETGWLFGFWERVGESAVCVRLSDW